MYLLIVFFVVVWVGVLLGQVLLWSVGVILSGQVLLWSVGASFSFEQTGDDCGSVGLKG